MKVRQRHFWFNEPHDAPLPIDREIVVDCFAGGGGASVGLEWATGMQVDVAINHNAEAIAMHMANHPQTKHYCENLWDVDPVKVCEGRSVGAAWFSPDCTHFSKAKGKQPRKKEIRALAWIVLRWAARVRPRVIFLENVEEFVTWGPLDKRGQPIRDQKGKTFEGWVQQLRELGYVVEWRNIVASDYGSPTTRRRLFLIARCDGQPIVWPAATHGGPRQIAQQIRKQGYSRLKKWRTAAEIIDWSIPCPSIFLTPEEAKQQGCRRPLAEKTLNRIAEGIRRYVIETADPYIVKVNHGSDHFRGQSLADPIPTQTTENRFSLVSAFLAKHFGGMVGIPADRPFPTITTRGTQNQLVAVNLVKNNHGQKQAFAIHEPLRTVCAQESQLSRVQEVRSFLVKYYGSGGQWNSIDAPAPTITVRDRLALGIVLVGGEPFQIVDIGMRMLTPRELFNAQGFPANYDIDTGVNGKPATKSQQVARCGNSVCLHPASAIVAANFQIKQHARTRDGFRHGKNGTGEKVMQ